METLDRIDMLTLLWDGYEDIAALLDVPDGVDTEEQKSAFIRSIRHLGTPGDSVMRRGDRAYRFLKFDGDTKQQFVEWLVNRCGCKVIEYDNATADIYAHPETIVEATEDEYLNRKAYEVEHGFVCTSMPDLTAFTIKP